MPKVRSIHYHTTDSGEERIPTRTPCGRHIRLVQWVTDWADVTCNACLKTKKETPQ